LLLKIVDILISCGFVLTKDILRIKIDFLQSIFIHTALWLN